MHWLRYIEFALWAYGIVGIVGLIIGATSLSMLIHLMMAYTWMGNCTRMLRGLGILPGSFHIVNGIALIFGTPTIHWVLPAIMMARFIDRHLRSPRIRPFFSLAVVVVPVWIILLEGLIAPAAAQVLFGVDEGSKTAMFKVESWSKTAECGDVETTALVKGIECMPPTAGLGFTAYCPAIWMKTGDGPLTWHNEAAYTAWNGATATSTTAVTVATTDSIEEFVTPAPTAGWAWEFGKAGASATTTPAPTETASDWIFCSGAYDLFLVEPCKALWTRVGDGPWGFEKSIPPQLEKELWTRVGGSLWEFEKSIHRQTKPTSSTAKPTSATAKPTSSTAKPTNAFIDSVRKLLFKD